MRIRKTKAEIEQIEAQIYDVLDEDRPQSVRHIFYRMTDPRLTTPVDKTEHGYKQVQSRISIMRRRGDLPYGWITDATRRGFHTETFSSAHDFLERFKYAYRADLWADNPNYVEVWCESRSIAGVIQRTCEEYAVSLYPAGGFSSLTLIYDSAQHINTVCGAKEESEISFKSALPLLGSIFGEDFELDDDFDDNEYADAERTANVIYIGDYDPAGVLIDKSIEKDLRKHLRVPLRFTRLGINAAQIELYDLPTKPRKKTDRRVLHIKETVEAEAMPAALLREMLAGRIKAFIPEDAWDKVQVAEESEKMALDLVGSVLAGEKTGSELEAYMSSRSQL